VKRAKSRFPQNTLSSWKHPSKIAKTIKQISANGLISSIGDNNEKDN